ncbi:hypothetical protein [Spirosoma sordidisoli]|uniref:Uncharacterized protein n=1 Tax=Spirosoma sordidisoli TaxID=2502893 RepID=A0A4Q2UCS0_9BACT|nr:hypothetical protein [Spirosoma sordidisoli]RYC66576.1 hypothetical protein EQG79_28695 [Spirosoma sordidisoli]
MKYIFQSITMVILCVCLDGCFLILDPCPKDQKLGDLQLTNPNFSPYRGDETLVFINQTGQKISLTNFEYSTLSTRQRLVVSTPCYKSDWVKQQVYYDVPRVFISYRLSKTNYLTTLDYSFGIQDLRMDQARSDTILAEDMTISNTFVKPGTLLRVLVSDRGNRAKFDTVNGQYPRLIQYRVISDTAFNGNLYKQVYCSKELPTIYFTTKDGIIAFKDQQQWWYKSY